jgi:pimeloyl-ACP methyl ester carboxylesterase
MKRRFADLPHGQMHFRTDGAGGLPLVMLHGAAANGASLLPVARAIAATRCVLLPDVPGCGDSDALPGDAPEIADFAAALFAFLDALRIDRCDLHGAHLGARIATEAAIRRPARIRRIILDGVGFYDDVARVAMLARVAPAVLPDPAGDYLRTAHAMCRDYFRFFPWFARDAAHRRDVPEPAAEEIHAKLLEVLRNGSTYPSAYHAALRYRMEDALPRLRHPTLLSFARTDNVFAQRHRAAELLPAARMAETPGLADPAATATIFADFLDATGEDDP